jgi:hypothetical protein
MEWPVSIGWLLFVGVPAVLWILGAWANRGHGIVAKILGFAVGTDNRLSLSRIQAFVWTLVIFGSFAAAMSIHKDIAPATQAEVDAATKKAKEAADAAATKKAAYQSALADAAASETARKAAHDALVQAEAEAKVLAQRAAAAPKDGDLAAKNKAAQETVLKAQVAFAGQDALAAVKKRTADDAQAISKQAEEDAQNAQKKVPLTAWVQIPAALLALAGIAIGSGVFSSLISALGNEQQTASITAITAVKFGSNAAQGQIPLPPGPDVQSPDPSHPDSLLIQGSHLGVTKGTVRLYASRFSKDLARVIYWHDNEIAIDLAPGATYTKMTVDTAYGKLTYGLSGKHPALKLGPQIMHYEFVDLFRDDKNPDTLSLMKFQMFGWTVIAVAIYVYLFLTHLSADISTLPVVDPSIVILTGVSQAGYLAGKGVSNLG